LIVTAWSWLKLYSPSIGRLWHHRGRRSRRRKPAQHRSQAELLEQRQMMAVVSPTFEVTGQWGNDFEARITLENPGSQPVNDWTLSFDYEATISAVWGASLLSRDGGRYTIANEGWNADLEAGKSLVFHLLGSTDLPPSELGAPGSYAVNGRGVAGLADGGPSPSTDDAVPTHDAGEARPAPGGSPSTINFRTLRDWGEGFSGEIAVTNQTDGVLAGWEASFDFSGTIDSVWNGVLVRQSATRYTVRGPSGN